MPGIITQVSDGLPFDVIYELGRVGLWLQALGLVILLTIIFQVIAFILNRKRFKEIKLIKEDMARIEGKIDFLLTQSKMRNLKR